MEDWQVPLWDAINRYVVSCGGDPSKHVNGNTPRMEAVVEVNSIVRRESSTSAKLEEARGCIKAAELMPGEIEFCEECRSEGAGL